MPFFIVILVLYINIKIGKNRCFKNVRLAGEIAVHLAVAVFDCVFLCCPFSHEITWMRSGTYLSQFLRVFLPTLNPFLYRKP